MGNRDEQSSIEFSLTKGIRFPGDSPGGVKYESLPECEFNSGGHYDENFKYVPNWQKGRFFCMDEKGYPVVVLEDGSIQVCGTAEIRFPNNPDLAVKRLSKNWITVFIDELDKRLRKWKK